MKLLTFFDLARGQIRDEFEMGHAGIVRIERDERDRENGALLARPGRAWYHS